MARASQPPWRGAFVRFAQDWLRLSSHRFQLNEMQMWLSVIAYNLGTLWRRVVTPEDRQLVLSRCLDEWLGVCCELSGKSKRKNRVEWVLS